MDKKTLKQIEREACVPLHKYTDRDINGKLLSQWEKDANGEWQDVTSIRQAEEHYIETARRAGIPEKQIEQTINEARAKHDKQNHTT